MSQFTIPRNIYYGCGSISEVTSMKAERVMIVGDPIMLKLGWIDHIKKLLEDNGSLVKVFTDVESDPSRSTVAKGLNIMNEFGPDLVIGIGGGSAIDASKAMWVFYELPEMTWDLASVPFSLPPLRKKAFYIAIPSTSGTGTEVGIGAVITNKDVTPAVKKSIDSYEVTPDAAIIDPDLCLTVPPDVTANTGMDVISHALEAYVATGANEISDGLAIKAIQLVFEWLPIAFANGDNLIAREKMHLASAIAGMAFNNTGLGVIHSLAHQLGAVWGVPHGRANAIIMPYVIAYNAKIVSSRYADVALSIGVNGATVEQLVNGLIKRIIALMNTVNVPTTISALNIDQNEFVNLIDKMAINAFDDACSTENPRQPTVEELKKLYMSAWDGKVCHI